MGELEGFKGVVVFTFDDDVGGFVSATVNRAESLQAWIDRVAKLGYRDEIRDSDHLLCTLESCERSYFINDLEDEARVGISTVFPQHDFGASPNRVLWQDHALG